MKALMIIAVIVILFGLWMAYEIANAQDMPDDFEDKL
jgi:hypothetical protein